MNKFFINLEFEELFKLHHPLQLPAILSCLDTLFGHVIPLYHTVGSVLYRWFVGRIV